MQSQLAHLTKRRQECNGEISAAAEPMRADEQTLVGKLDERLIVEADLGNARQAMDDIDAQLRETEQQRNERNGRSTRSASSPTTSASRFASRRSAPKPLPNNSLGTGFMLDEITAGLPADATAAVWKETFEQLERRIQRLGAINLAALDEFQGAVRAQEVPRRAERRPDRGDRRRSRTRSARSTSRRATRFTETFDQVNARSAACSRGCSAAATPISR